jgi:putative hydrolase of the HAD superfamily
LDNTLYDRDAAMAAWIRSVFPGRPEVAEEALRLDDSGFIPRRRLYEWMVDRVDWASTWTEVARRYQNEVLAHVTDDPAITAAVAGLAGKYRLGVLTNGDGVFQREKLGRLGVAVCFEARFVFASGDIGHEKPDPRAFAPLLGALELDPGEVLFVGDNPTNDIEGAARLGMRTCWIRLAERHRCGVEPDLTLASVAQLPEWLGAVG